MMDDEFRVSAPINWELSRPSRALSPTDSLRVGQELTKAQRAVAMDRGTKLSGVWGQQAGDVALGAVGMLGPQFDLFRDFVVADN